MQTRRKFLRTSTLAGAALSLASTAKAQPTVAPKGLAKPPRQPNLLFLWTDQHRGDVMPYVNPTVRAPALARLGQESFCFTRAYCTQPVCTPSRGSILTGLYPHNHGAVQNNIPLPPQIKTLAEHASGYQTAYYGKWHLGDELSAQHGFQQWRSIEDYYRKFYTNSADRQRFSDYHNFLLQLGYPPDLPDPDTGTPIFSRTLAAALPERYTKVAYLANEAVAFLRQRDRSRPFILSVNTLEPHSPTYGPLNEVHDPAAVAVGPAFAQPIGESASRLHRTRFDVTRRDGYKNHPLASEGDWRRLRANYHGLVTMVDNAYGRVLRALEESGEADNTIIVYTSDHGDMCGDHSLMRKEVFYEGAVHVPLLLHVPWLGRSHVKFTHPVSQIDLVPTLLDLLGVSAGGSLDGASRTGWLRDPASVRAEAIVIEWTDAEQRAFDGRSILTPDGWKLNLYREDAPELYNLQRDPGELRNVAHESSNRERLKRLKDELHRWQQGVRDTLALAT